MRFVLCIIDDVVKRLALNQTLLLWSAIHTILAMFCILYGCSLRVYLALIYLEFFSPYDVKITTEMCLSQTSLWSGGNFIGLHGKCKFGLLLTFSIVSSETYSVSAVIVLNRGGGRDL